MLKKNHDFGLIEKKWQKQWENWGVYNWDEAASREETFVVDTPPPTVSGQLHMGHVFSYTHTDIVVRFQRMLGKNIFYPIGFDNNGLPTERLVENEKKIRASNFKREEFVKLCKEVSEEVEKKFRVLIKHLGLSVDWRLEYSTSSSLVTKVSQMSFLDLFKKKELYKAEQPVLWDPADKTALAQGEIEDKEMDSIMNEIEFGSTSGEKIIIATTRPELLGACVAVFYNPGDQRYQKFAGHYAITPLFSVKVPILADESVEPEKGTGLVMCCTFGDMMDIYWWKRHNLPTRIILDESAKIKQIKIEDSIFQDKAEKALKRICGLEIKNARSQILEMLKSEKLLLKQHSVKHFVKCAERSGAPLEILTKPQWFIKILEHKNELLKKSQELHWYPVSMKIRLDNWIKSLSWDWCISRQRFFGVPIPIWYSKRPNEEGKVLLPMIYQLPIDPLKDLPVGYSAEEVTADTDVMDTWATSSISPQINSHAISADYAIDINRHKRLFPADLRPQSHEIIRVWACNTILKSYLHEEKLPWKNIMISGWCLAEDKSKMSKSRGNVVTPEDILTKFGTDVVRYWAASAKLGTDVTLSEDVLHNGKRLINKIWNAANFISTHLALAVDLEKVKHSTDLWILSNFKNLVIDVTAALDKFDYSTAMNLIERFFWVDFCDNYLEIIKVRIYNEGPGRVYAATTSCYIFKNLLKLFAPFFPYVSEEIYSFLFNSESSIHTRSSWPSHDVISFNEETLKQGKLLTSVLGLVRKYKAGKHTSVKASIKSLEFESVIQMQKDVLLDLKQVTASQSIMQVNSIESGDDVLANEEVKIRIA